MNILQILYKILTKIYTNAIFQVLVLFVFLIVINLDYLKNNDYINSRNDFSIKNIQNDIFNRIISKNPKIINEITNNKKNVRNNNLDIVQINDNVKVEIRVLDNTKNKQQNQTIINYIDVSNDNILSKYLLGKKINNEVIIPLRDIAAQTNDGISRNLTNSSLFYKVKIISINEDDNEKN